MKCGKGLTNAHQMHPVHVAARSIVRHCAKGQHPGDRLDCLLPVGGNCYRQLRRNLQSRKYSARLKSTGPHLVDESADQRWRGSSSRAKKVEAAFRISLASLRSRFSRSRSLIRCCSTEVAPGR